MYPGLWSDKEGLVMKRLADLGLIFTSPSTVARNVMADPNWVIPLIAVLVVSFVSGVLVYQYQMELQKEQAAQFLREHDTDVDLGSRFEVTETKRIGGGIWAAVTMGVFALVIAAVLKGFAAVAGGGVGFRRMFAFSTYSLFVLALGNLIKAPLVMAKGSADVRTSLAILVPSKPLFSPLVMLLNSFDVFSIWALVTLCFGYGVLSGLGIKKASGIVVGLWVVLVVIIVVLASLPRLLSGS
jgi:hypothetical protein